MTSPVALSVPSEGFIDKTRTQPTRKVNVATVDGGGVRGIIPATILSEIEKITEMKSAQLFDVMGGVSTGGIVTLALNVQDQGLPIYSAQEVVSIFKEECPKVFPQTWIDHITPIRDAEELIWPKYGSKPLQQLAQERLGNRLLKDTATDVYIASWEWKWRKTWEFTSLYAQTKPAWQDLQMADVLLSTTAAPTYFEPHPLTLDGHDYLFQDGGLINNNPCWSTTCYARKNYSSYDFNVICSLGTGALSDAEPRQPPKTWGLVGAAPEVADDMITSGEDISDQYMCQFFSHEGENATYHRLQPTISLAHDALDDASESNFQYLQDQANQYIEDNHDLIRRMALNLLKHREGDLYPVSLRV